ncbi:LysR family transcriptional regulator [Lactiplantibacillus plajomi]|uniref:LysR family transcriptional regulator n=1 Tax=Lactiplantibacillus plajomi TaxID=1457217 RepID=A0ABV6K4Y8_9LACO|nr:LysR family transcriptional regulator [Lactiplantibacillus plajomi]
MANNPNRVLKEILTTVQTAATLTQVAEWRYTSQPNISKVLTAAEREYGVQLVNRQQTPISLTAAGEQLLSRLEAQLRFDQQTHLEMRQFQSNPPFQLRLAFFPTYAPIILPKITSALQTAYPKLQLETVSLTTAKALAALKDGQVAIFIGRNASDPTIQSIPLFTEQLCFVISATSPLYHPDQFCRDLTATDLVTLQAENYIKWSAETSFIDVTSHFFHLNDLHFSSNVTVATYEEAMLCAAQGVGITMAMQTTANYFLRHRANVNLLVVPARMASLEISIMTGAHSETIVQKLAQLIATKLRP